MRRTNWAFGTRSACIEIEVDRVCGGELVIHAVEDVFFVAFVVHDGKFRAVEKPAAVQSASSDEISPLLAAVGEVETRVAVPNVP